ncbi:hypothetical protein FNV43_RR09200 [Rhamnella rubrinervis]|uniref:BAG family molecular chaperone regulator 1 n=1 Tax=Rhamnella rubrinervis TaxID=2594499 RepID=A0A8K0H9K2_9ROSA|nr:hypothetical protein FNV43_RR09200 [Rhamnella rubrinervis]
MFSSTNKASVSGGEKSPSLGGLDVRPGGLLVQQRNSDMRSSSVSVSNIRVRVKYGSSYHDIYISSQASFGELKKKLAEPTGVHHLDQKLIFNNKERDSKAFLDVMRVKDGSKMVLLEDVASKERRYLEMCRISAVEKATNSLAKINFEVDKLEGEVTTIENKATRGGKVAEKDVVNLSEILMSKLILLDGIVADGELKQQRGKQVRRVQKYIETLDLLRLQSSKTSIIADKTRIQQQMNSISHMPKPMQKIMQVPQMPKKPLEQSESLVVSTKWETFE